MPLSKLRNQPELSEYPHSECGPCSAALYLQYDYFRSGVDPFVEVNNVLVDHPYTARGRGLTDAPGLGRSMDAKQRVLAIFEQV